MKRPWVIVVLSLPLLVFALAIVNAERHLSTGQIYRFAIAGYDPRDLLRGRYLQFSLMFDWQEGAGRNCRSESPNEACCFCLTKNGDAPPKVAVMTCEEARGTCDDVLIESSLNDVNRFYVPEESAKKAERILLEAQRADTAFARISITRDGSSQLVDLEIAGESIDDLIGRE